MATDETEDRYGDDARLRRLLRERLPRHPAPAGLRSSIVEAASGGRPRSVWWWRWGAPATAALAMAMLMLLVMLPSLPSSTSGDPVRLVSRAVLNQHARTILWGESHPDVVPAVLPRAMEESGVALNLVFSGDDKLRLVDAQPVYLDGRLGIELAYRDADGHTVSYVVLPARTLTLPDRGRAQIAKWRPLIRTEGGFSMILWKQQDLLCALVSDLVSADDLARLKDYFVKVRSSTEPYAVY